LLARQYAWRTLGLSRYAIAPAIPRRLDSLSNARRVAVPGLFLVSKQDQIVPAPYQREVIGAYGGRTTVLEVAGRHDERALQPEDEAAYRRMVRALVASV